MREPQCFCQRLEDFQGSFVNVIWSSSPASLNPKVIHPEIFWGLEGSWSQSQQSLGVKNVSPSWSTHMRTVKFPRRGPCSNMKWRIAVLNSKLCQASVSRRGGVNQQTSSYCSVLKQRQKWFWKMGFSHPVIKSSEAICPSWVPHVSLEQFWQQF